MMSRQTFFRLVLILVLITGLFLVVHHLDLGDRLMDLRRWIESIGPMGPLAYLFLYIGAVVLAVPGSAVTALAGVLFGSVLGTILVSLGSTLGAGVCFIIARFLARDAVTRLFKNNAHFHRLDSLTREHGALMVAIARLVPLFPFNVLNYGFGLTGISFRTYFFWSWLCMLPGTVLYVAGADAVTRAISEGRVPWPLVIFVVVVAVILFLLVSRARRRLDKKPEEGDVRDVDE